MCPLDIGLGWNDLDRVHASLESRLVKLIRDDLDIPCFSPFSFSPSLVLSTSKHQICHQWAVLFLSVGCFLHQLLGLFSCWCWCHQERSPIDRFHLRSNSSQSYASFYWPFSSFCCFFVLPFHGAPGDVFVLVPLPREKSPIDRFHLAFPLRTSCFSPLLTSCQQPNTSFFISVLTLPLLLFNIFKIGLFLWAFQGHFRGLNLLIFFHKRNLYVYQWHSINAHPPSWKKLYKDHWTIVVVILRRRGREGMWGAWLTEVMAKEWTNWIPSPHPSHLFPW